MIQYDVQCNIILIIITLLAAPSSCAVKQPNIIFILVDDVGWADFNYTTKLPTSIPTPNIDNLAR